MKPAKTISSLWAAMLLFAGLAAAAPGKTAAPRILTVGVTGSFRAAPDEAILAFDAHGEAPQVADAYRQAVRQTAAIRSLLQRHAIPAQAATYSQYVTAPVINWKNQKVTGYRVDAAIQLRLSDFRLIGPLLSDAAEQNLNALRSLNFTLRHPLAAKRRAIADAYRKAQQEALALAAAAGEKLGRLRQAQLDVNLSAPRPMMMVAAFRTAAPSGIVGNFHPGRITVQARLTAIFGLR